VVYFDPHLLQVLKIELLRDCKRTSSSSSSLFVQIKIHDANKEHMIKPEQDSKVEKTTLTAALE